MESVSTFITACAIWWLASLCLLLGSAVATCMLPFFRSQEKTRIDQPPLSVIVPVKDLTVQLEAAFVTLFSQSYPTFEVLVSTTEEPSPALDLARGVAARYPHIRSRFFSNNPGVALNPKINNLATPLSEAEYDLILLKDSAVLLEASQLSEVVGYFSEDIGLVVATPVGIRPNNFAAEIECAIINGYVARFLLAASAIGWGFGIGAISLFDRRDFIRAGGIASIASAIGEDHALSKVLNSMGRKTTFAGKVVKQEIGWRKFSDVWNRQLRWAICRRIEAPIPYYAELFTCALVTAMAGAFAAPLLGIPKFSVFIGTILIWPVTETLLIWIKGWGLSWKTPLATLLFTFIFPVLWIRARLSRSISWGNVTIKIHGSAGRKFPSIS